MKCRVVVVDVDAAVFVVVDVDAAVFVVEDTPSLLSLLFVGDGSGGASKDSAAESGPVGKDSSKGSTSIASPSRFRASISF